MTLMERVTQLAGESREVAGLVAARLWERVRPMLGVAAVVIVCFLITFADALGEWLIP